MKSFRLLFPLAVIALFGAGCQPEPVRVPEPVQPAPITTPAPVPTPGDKLGIVLTQATGTVEVLTASSTTWVASPAGTTVQPGDHVRTAKTGTATLVFFSRSATRLDRNTEIEIKADTSVNAEQPRIQNIDLEANKGRIWSRTLKLLDAGSSYKVSHGNVVATVRGTAFNFAVTKVGADIDVVEHTVGVGRGDETVPVPEGSSIDVNASSTEDLSKDVKPTPDESKDPWFQQNEEEDEKFVREQGSAWEQFSKDEGFFDPTRDVTPIETPVVPPEPPKPETPAPPTPPAEPPHVNGPAPKAPVTPVIAPSTPVAPAPVTFDRIDVTSLPNAAAADTVKFVANAIYSDGHTEDVTGVADWRVETAGAGTISTGVLTMAATTPDVIYVSATWNGKKGTGSIAVYFGPPR